MQQVNIISNVVVVDIIVVAEFKICSIVVVSWQTTCAVAFEMPMLFQRKLRILTAGKNFFILWPFWARFCVNCATYTQVYMYMVVSLIIALYNNSVSCVRASQSDSAWFTINSGVHEGLAPDSFATAVDWLSFILMKPQ